MVRTNAVWRATEEGGAQMRAKCCARTSSRRFASREPSASGGHLIASGFDVIHVGDIHDSPPRYTGRTALLPPAARMIGTTLA